MIEDNDVNFLLLVLMRWNCVLVDICIMVNNMGWRYVMFISGVLVLVLLIFWLIIICLKEILKYFLGVGEDVKVVEIL